ncbi:MAG: MFS transporter [Alphaproteobacteria bacterium]|nr:MFS transporter [Alphaproteobacteria bacterium]
MTARPFYRNPLVVVVCAMTIIMLSFGIRQSFGMFMAPISTAMGWGRETLSFAIALQNLMIGLCVPFAGMIADRWGPIRVIMIAGTIYAIGLVLVAHSTTPEGMVFTAGVLAGLGISGCGLPLLISVVGRVAPENRRSLWLGITAAGGTGGQLVVVPLSQLYISSFGWITAMLLMAAMAALIVPFGAGMIAAAREGLGRPAQQSLGEALREAGRHSGYWLLVIGFFVCGFQVQFVATHLPAYLADSGASAALGATAIAVIGLFNLMGTWIAGWLGGIIRKKYVLSLLYVGRSFAMIAFISVPVTEVSVIVFAAVLGLLWLGTVPLTSGIVAQIFGTRYMATLFGIAFLSHQIGSFLGVWLGGLIYDVTGSYMMFWWLAIAMGFVAALVNSPMNDRPVARLAAERA